jgi:hypothetical protein
MIISISMTNTKHETQNLKSEIRSTNCFLISEDKSGNGK